MKIFKVAILALMAGIVVGCKKDISSNTPNEPTEPEVKVQAKDTIYLVKSMVTNYLLTPYPVSQTETFTYNSSLQLTRHKIIYNSHSQNSTTYNDITYSDGKVIGVEKRGAKTYSWTKMQYDYLGNKLKMYYFYPDKKDSLTITLSTKGFAKKVQGNGQFYLLTYDKAGNITNRSQYDNRYPTKATASIDYKFDNRRNPFLAQRANYYLLYQAFNDINSYTNNRISYNNLEFYNITYNKANYPTRIVYVNGPVAVRTVDYTYTKVIVDKP